MASPATSSSITAALPAKATTAQNQALNALAFFYREALHQNLDGPLHPVRAKRPERLPVVLTRAEDQAVLRCFD